MQSVVDPFDRGNGTGSCEETDDWLDSKSIYDNEWGSTAATTFNASEFDFDGDVGSLSKKQKQERLERLYARHNGKGESDRQDSILTSYILNDTRLFLSILEMPDNQRETVIQIIESMDISSNGSGGTRYEKIILAVCSLVSDEALSNQPDPSLSERLYQSKEYRELMEANRMTGAEHRRLRVHVREKSDYFSK